MRNQKKYTNATFTKRVDHEGGMHRPPRPGVEPAVCEICGAVYADKRWSLRSASIDNDTGRHWKPSRLTICPACTQIRQGIVGGYVSVGGSFLKGHRREIESLLRNEELRELQDNPLSRIMNWRDRKDRIEIETTNEHIAQRLGNALKRAFDGDVNYDFSHENKVARVTWRRD